MMKIASAVFLLIVSVCIAGCCTDETADPAPPGGTQETPAQQYPEINVSEIPVATPELIRTNGSYIAGIALGDERARVLVRHGGKPESVAVLFHSCPRNDPYCNRNPSLVIRYGEIRLAITVDEAAGTVLGGFALVPNTPDPNKPSPTYYKIHDLSTGTDTVYLGNAPIMTYNKTALLYLNESYGYSIGAVTNPAPPLAITPVIVYTLKEAHEKFGMDLPAPSYLPDGYSFSYALQYGEPDNRTSLIYAKGKDEFHITQVPVPGNPCPGLKTTGSVGVTIDGTDGTFTPGDGENVLRWNDSHYAYCLSGTQEMNEMAAIAASVKEHAGGGIAAPI